MRHVTLNIPESEYNFFMKVISNFSFVEIAKDRQKLNLEEIENHLTAPKKKLWNDIKEGLEEIKLIEEGKQKAKTAKDLLNEL